MSNESNSSNEKAESLIYQIRIKGHLDRKWADWFSGLSITSLENGETLLTGLVLDQAALHGLLRKVRDVGLPLVAVMQVEPEQADVPDAKP
jgi:hypothetical protein